MATLRELEDALISASESGDDESAAALVDEINRMKAAPPAAPETPQLNIPADPIGTPAETPTGADIMATPRETGWRRNQLLPREVEYTVDETGRMHDTGESRWAMPGILADVPEQVEALGSHPLGTEYTDEDIGAMLGLAGFGVSPSIGGKSPLSIRDYVMPKEPPIEPLPAVKSLLAGPQIAKGGIMDELMGQVKTRVATERGTARAQILREEALKMIDKYGKYMRPSEIEQINKIVQRGAGPVRTGVENWAGRKGLGAGFDVGSLALTGSSLAALGPGIGAKVAATRAAAGALDKAGILAARSVRSALTRKDIRDLNKTLPFGARNTVRRSGGPPVEATRKAFESQGTAPKTGRPPTAKEATETTPEPYTPPTQPTSPLSANRPTAEIEMNIGERSVKSKGSLAPKEPTTTPKTGRITLAGKSQTVETPAGPKSVLAAPETPGSKTLPVKVLGEAERKAMEEYMAEGGTVTRPPPKEPPKAPIVAKPKPIKPVAKSVLTSPKTGRLPTAREALETMPESESWLPKPDEFYKGPTPPAAIVKPKGVLAEPAPTVTTPKEPRVAKKAEARQARKAEEAAKEANKEKMREILQKKAKRGRGSY